MRIVVDADGCPVRYEIAKVALRYRIPTVFVANTSVETAAPPLFSVQLVAGDFNAADDWIAEQASPADIVVTGDVPLAERCVAAGAIVLGHRGNRFTPASIGGQVAMRDLMSQLRQTGAARGGPPPFSDRDRSRFMSALDEAANALRRRSPASPPEAPADG